MGCVVSFVPGDLTALWWMQLKDDQQTLKTRVTSGINALQN